MKNPILYFVAIIGRLLIGILLMTSAKQSKYPIVIKTLGFLGVFAAVVFVLIGPDSFQNFIGALIFNLRPYGFVSGLISITLGSFLVYAFLDDGEL